MEYSQTILKCVDLGQKRCFSGSANIKTEAHIYVKWAGQPPASIFGRCKQHPHNKLSSEIRHFRAFWFDWETLLHWITWKSYHGQFLNINLGTPYICVHALTHVCAPPRGGGGATVICCGSERTNTEIWLSVQRQWTAFLTQQQQALSQAEQRHLTLQDSHFPEEHQS